jgi:hypothetical protein
MAVVVAGRTVAVITSCDVTGLLLGIDLIGVPENVQVVPVGRPEQERLIEFGNWPPTGVSVAVNVVLRQLWVDVLLQFADASSVSD